MSLIFWLIAGVPTFSFTCDSSSSFFSAFLREDPRQTGAAPMPPSAPGSCSTSLCSSSVYQNMSSAMQCVQLYITEHSEMLLDSLSLKMLLTVPRTMQIQRRHLTETCASLQLGMQDSQSACNPRSNKRTPKQTNKKINSNDVLKQTSYLVEFSSEIRLVVFR